MNTSICPLCLQTLKKGDQHGLVSADGFLYCVNVMWVVYPQKLGVITS